MISLIRYPSAWIPLALSLAVLATMLIAFSLFGVPEREPDEGAAAHLFQMWLVFEVFAIGFFLIKWLPQAPNQALRVLVLQIAAVLAACSPVFYFNL